MMQTFQEWELIVVDDASKDDTVDIVEDLTKQDSRINIIRLSQNNGSAIARNIGIRMACGRYIAFLDSDDIWYKDKLRQQIKFMEQKNVPFTYTAYERINEKGDVINCVDIPEAVTYSELLCNSVIGCLTAVYDRQVLGTLEMPLIKKRQDLGLWLHILRHIPMAYGLPVVLAQYRVRSGSISSSKISAAKYTWLLYRNYEKLPIMPAMWFFTRYTISGIRKTYLSGLSQHFQRM